MPNLVPVDDDPFAPKAGGPQLVPVEHDPFAKGVGAIDFSAPDDQVRAAISKLPEKERAAALNQWGDAYVARERAGQGEVTKALGDQARNLARGTWFGSWLDEANAKTSELTGGNYDEALAYQHAKDRATDKDSGWAGTAAKVTGGLASLPLSLGARLIGAGGNVATRVAQGGLVGGLEGAAYGAGDGNGSLLDRGWDALKGGGIGVGVGMAAPVVGQAIGTARNYLADRLQGVPQQLRGYARGAVDNIAGAVGADRQAGTLRMPGQFGQEGMVLDAGPEVLAHAEAIASRPGPGRPDVIGAVTQRGQGAAGRITSDVDAALGQQRDTPALLKRMQEARATDANGLYGAVRGDPNAEAIWSPELQQLTRRPSVRQAINAVAETAAERGHEVTNPFRPAENGIDLELPQGTAPNFTFWDNVKRGIDKQIDADPRNGDLIRTKNELLRILDEQLPSYAGARKRFADQSEVIKAVDEGRQAFKKGTDPNEMRLRMDDMSDPAREGYKVGGRQNVADIMGEAVDPESQARRAFKSPYARQRLGLVAGEDGANRLTNRLDTEDVFQQSENAIRGGSQTARRQAFQELYPAPGAEQGNAVPLDTSMTGLIGRLGQKAVNAFTGGAMDARNAAVAKDAARILTAGGPKANELVNALLGRSDVLTRRAGDNAQIDRLVQALLSAQRPALVGSQTGQR